MLIAYLDLERKIVEQFARDYPAHSVRKLMIMSGEFDKYWKKKEAEILHGKTIACNEFDEFIENVEKEAKRSAEFIKNYWAGMFKKEPSHEPKN